MAQAQCSTLSTRTVSSTEQYSALSTRTMSSTDSSTTEIFVTYDSFEKSDEIIGMRSALVTITNNTKNLNIVDDRCSSHALCNGAGCNPTCVDGSHACTMDLLKNKSESSVS